MRVCTHLAAVSLDLWGLEDCPESSTAATHSVAHDSNPLKAPVTGVHLSTAVCLAPGIIDRCAASMYITVSIHSMLCVSLAVAYCLTSELLLSIDIRP
jgi:hypothetical protein